MTATTHPTEGLGPDGPTPGIESTGFSPEPGATRVEVPLGRRVMVVSDLLLTPEATPTSTAVSEAARPRRSLEISRPWETMRCGALLP